MTTPRCPGQDPQYWKPEDIFLLKCPFCGTEIEFWKDEPVRPCSSCGREIPNPKISQGCSQWCQHAEDGCPAQPTVPPRVTRSQPTTPGNAPFLAGPDSRPDESQG